MFFVGLIGERYGWIPEEDFYPNDVLEDPNLAWVKEHIGGKSVTELEILHGVLNNPAMNERAFFYFRNDGFEKRYWEAIQRTYGHLQPADFTNERDPDPVAASQKQQSLKAAITSAGLKHTPRPYETPADLAQTVLEDLWSEIDRAFPAADVPDAFEQESLDHVVFRDSRTRAYVERQGLFDTLDAHAAGEGPPCRIVLGESGSGKSALLAAWLTRQEDKVLFHHFIGATPRSLTAENLLRRLLETIRRRGYVPPGSSIPPSLAEMNRLLPRWLAKLPDNNNQVILIDAVNQLPSTSDRQLAWWPQEWPAHVRVVFSTLRGDALRAMEKRGWKGPEYSFAVPPLKPGEKQEILESYLRLFVRELQPELQKQILDAPQTANPLFLRTLLDELRLRSAHEDLAHNLTAMLRCHDPAALFVHVLKHVERDFSPAGHPTLVHQALGLMGMARRGLAESEILELMSRSDTPVNDPLPRHYWSPLYLALEDSLVSRDGQLNFFHDYLRQAVWREYLDEPEEQAAAHQRLAMTVLRWRDEYFGPSLRAYGFDHGIGHLLEVRRINDAVRLVTDETYRASASHALRSPDAVLRDVRRLLTQAALEPSSDQGAMMQLAMLALTGRQALERDLLKAMDAAAKRGEWEEAASIAEAAPAPQEQMLRGLRALLRSPEKPSTDFAERMRRLAGATGRPEWEEIRIRLITQKETSDCETHRVQQVQPSVN